MSGVRSFDFTKMEGADCYRLMASSIMPRPIAWVTSISPEGVRNAAPYSFFNMMGSEPPVVALGILPGDVHQKDTARNLRDGGEFVVNLVSEAMAAQMNETCAALPPEVDELTLAGVATAPSTQVAPPRITGAPVAYECRVAEVVNTGPHQLLIVGRVLAAHFHDTALTPGDRPRVIPEALDLIGRMYGADAYVRTHDVFHMPRPK